MAKKKYNIVTLAIAIIVVIAIACIIANLDGTTGRAIWIWSITGLTGLFPTSEDLAGAWTIVGPEQMQVEVADLDGAYVGYYSMPSENSADVAEIKIYRFLSEDAANDFYQRANNVAYMYGGVPVESGSSDSCSTFKVETQSGDIAQSNCINGNVVYEVQAVSTTGHSGEYMQQMNSIIDGKF